MNTKTLVRFSKRGLQHTWYNIFRTTIAPFPYQHTKPSHHDTMPSQGQNMSNIYRYTITARRTHFETAYPLMYSSGKPYTSIIPSYHSIIPHVHTTIARSTNSFAIACPLMWRYTQEMYHTSIRHSTIPSNKTVSSPHTTIHTVCNYVRKYKDTSYTNIKLKISLYLGTEWYHAR